jgi:hypothetical protein
MGCIYRERRSPDGGEIKLRPHLADGRTGGLHADLLSCDKCLVVDDDGGGNFIA